MINTTASMQILLDQTEDRRTRIEVRALVAKYAITAADGKQGKRA